MIHKKEMLLVLCFIIIAISSVKAQNATIKDIDGNTYNTVTIGTQTWMKENLKVTKYRNGDPIPNITDSVEWRKEEMNIIHNGAYCAYNNSPSNAKTYGYLYNWYTVVDSRNLCPTGWHVPSNDEWNDLRNYLTSNDYGFQDDKKNIGKSLASKSGWAADNLKGNIGNDPGSNNKSGFTALPGGNRSSDVILIPGKDNVYYYIFVDVKKIAYWWSSTEVQLEKDDYDVLIEEVSGDNEEPYEAYGIKLDPVYSKLVNSSHLKNNAYSVRCLKDK
ncbi:MAG: fibrobacter succinogenes major paralogous domain-containing protein [Bacteroidota bacterium]